MRPTYSLMLRRIAAASLVLGVAGCGWNTRQPPTTTVSAADAMPAPGLTVRDDLTTGKTVYYGAPVLSPEAPDKGRDGWRLRSEADKKTGLTAHFVDIRVHWNGSGIDYWKNVSARLGDDKDVAVLAASAPELSVGTCARVMWIGCDHDEQASARLSDGMLEQAAKRGLTLSFHMNHGRSYSVKIAPDQADMHLLELARAKGAASR